ALPSPSRCAWPRKSSSVVGRMRAARGSPLPRLPLPWKSVGSDTGCEMRDGQRGMRDARCGMRATNGPLLRVFGTIGCSACRHVYPMRKLQNLDDWGGAHELARSAYLLTMSPTIRQDLRALVNIRRSTPLQ